MNFKLLNILKLSIFVVNEADLDSASFSSFSVLYYIDEGSGEKGRRGR